MLVMTWREQVMDRVWIVSNSRVSNLESLK